MGAGRLRVRAGRGVAAVALAAALAALAAGCGRGAAPVDVAATSAPPPATPTMTPSAVPVLGPLTFGPFPATKDGLRALSLCETWAALRAQYVTRVGRETPYELELWFSSTPWHPAMAANGPLWTDPAYSAINAAFGLATTGQTASVANAKRLDAACAAAD
jgi:hypothetical protein